MAYTDVNTPVIEKITLPSGNSYWIADREIRDVVETLSQTIAGGVSYNVGWDGTSEPVLTQIPAGVTVTYNGQTYTGTLSADSATPGAFYLVKSETQVDGKDVYDEYVPVGETGSKAWEKIGDTQVALNDVVTDVALTKQTDTVIGTDSTFTVTQPKVGLATDSTSGTGKVQVVTGITSAAASGDTVTAVTGIGTPSKDTFLKGVKVTAQPTVTLTGNITTDTGRIQYVESQGTASTTKLKASVSLGTPTTSNVASSVTPTTKKLATTTVTGVSGSTTPSVVQGRTSQTTATGGATASTTNTDWLKGVSVTNKVLTFGAATPATQTTYSANSPTQITVPTAAASATTVATGSTTTTGSGADIVTDVAVGDTVAAVTGYASPTATISSGSTGDVTVATGIGAATTKYMSASASGTAVGADGSAQAITGITPTTDTVLGSGSTITVTPTTTNIKATATGGNVAWNNKDSVTVLKNTTDVALTKGGGGAAVVGDATVG